MEIKKRYLFFSVERGEKLNRSRSSALPVQNTAARGWIKSGGVKAPRSKHADLSWNLMLKLYKMTQLNRGWGLLHNSQSHHFLLASMFKSDVKTWVIYYP